MKGDKGRGYEAVSTGKYNNPPVKALIAMEFLFVECTDTGKVRKRNEDYLGKATNNHLGAHLFCVADGMGGYGAGDSASEVAVTSLIRSFLDLRSFPAASYRAIVQGLFSSAQESLAGFKETNGPSRMGTTLSAIIFSDKVVIYANIGDTRIYLFDGQRLVQKSYDHTLVNDLLQNNSITESQARSHPKKHVLTKAITGEGTIVEPHIHIDGFLNDHIYLICTDGLYNMVDESFMSAGLRESSIFEAKESFLKEAYAQGAKDNITFQIIRPADDEATQPQK